MEYEIIWEDEANEELQRILRYLDNEWSYEARSKFEKTLTDKLNALKLHPYRGNPSVYTLGVRSILVSKHNRLFYRVEADKIVIVSIQDIRGNPLNNIFREEEVEW